MNASEISDFLTGLDFGDSVDLNYLSRFEMPMDAKGYFVGYDSAKLFLSRRPPVLGRECTFTSYQFARLSFKVSEQTPAIPFRVGVGIEARTARAASGD